VLKSDENKHYYSYLHYRLKVYFIVLVTFTLVLAFLLYYPFAFYDLPRFEIISGCAFVSLMTFLISLYSSYKSSESVHSERLFKQKLSTIRAEIIKELGPEVVDALRSNECSKKCTEELQKLNLVVDKYKAFIDKLSKFQWCSGCSQNKKCSSNCGPDFWIFVKDALRGLKS
jgi:Ca2+/Na+ antiporter